MPSRGPPGHPGVAAPGPGARSPTAVGKAGVGHVGLAGWPAPGLAPALLWPWDVESPVLAAALELFDARQFPGVAAVCAEALVDAPGDVALRLLRARALLALRRDAETQAELGSVLRLEPRCAAAYRLLGELSARSDELSSARVFLREALRLAPDDEEAGVWLAIVDEAERASVDEAGRAGAPVARGERAAPAPVVEPRSAGPRAARVMPPPVPARASPPPIPPRRPPPATVHPPARSARGTAPPPTPRLAPPQPLAPPPRAARAALPPPFGGARPGLARPARGTAPPPTSPGFAGYLVEAGVLTELQLRAARAYERSTGVRLGAAAVALGFATESRIESAALVYHGRHRPPSSLDVIGTARA